MDESWLLLARGVTRCRRRGYNRWPTPTGEDNAMPEVVIYALGGRSLDQKRALCKDVTDAVVKNFKVEPGAVVVTLVETAKTDKSKGGVLFAEMGQK
jgi:4-oxalocrotonate tautomerase